MEIAGENVMRDHRFGVEIETVGCTQENVARAIARVVGGVATPGPRGWKVVDRQARTWGAVYDGSLSDRYAHAEIVTPILTYADIPELQEVVREVRKAGARHDPSTGIHIHIDGAPFDARAVRNLVKIMHKQEELIVHALGVSRQRLERFCKPIDAEFLRRIERSRPTSLNAVNALWYGHHVRSPEHYHYSRYHALNIHSLFYRGTIEFRLFEGTLHAGEIKSHIQFVLALAHMALKARASSSKRRPLNVTTAKYDFRCFLLRLGLIGDEFKTARQHLMKRLQGSAAWKNGRPERSTAPSADATEGAPVPSGESASTSEAA